MTSVQSVSKEIVNRDFKKALLEVYFHLAKSEYMFYNETRWVSCERPFTTENMEKKSISQRSLWLNKTHLCKKSTIPLQTERL